MTHEKSSRSAFYLILLTVFLDLVGFSIIFPLFPDMLEYYLGKEPAGSWLHGLIENLERLSGLEGGQARFAASVLFGGILGSLYSILQFIAAPIWGALSDRNGRRRILVMTVFGTALGYLMWVMADAFWLLILSRLFGGAMAGNLSVATAAIADVTDKKSRAKGMGMLGAAFGLGFIIGPAIGGVLSLVNVTGSLSFIPGINPFSVPAIVAMFMSVVNFILLLTIFPETLTVDSGNRSTRPINPLALFKPSRHAGVNLTSGLYFVFIAAFAAMEFTLVFLAKDRFGYTPFNNGMLFVYIGLIIIAVQGGVVRRVVPKYGEKQVALAGWLLVIPGLVIVGLCAAQWQMFFGLFLLSVGSSLVTPSLHSLISLYAPENEQGAVLGIFRSVGSLARAVAPIAGAAIYWKYGSEWPYLGAGLILLLTFFFIRGLPGVSKEDDLE